MKGCEDDDDRRGMQNQNTRIMNERGITLNKLAILSGVTQSTLNNIMSGRNNSATVSTVKKLCDGLEISIVDFFESQIFTDLEQEIK